MSKYTGFLADPKFMDAVHLHFEALDKVGMTPVSFFIDMGHKERYETQIMFVVRKYQAAIYHLSNVLDHLKRDAQTLEEVASRLSNPSDTKGAQITKMSQSSSGLADYYVYELSAFLEALKSALDFLAVASSYYLKGVKTDRTSTLIKLVQKGKTGPILDQVSANLEWLDHFRGYRHHLVHRLIFTVQSGYEIHRIKGKFATVQRPIIIPEHTPEYVSDTRRSRFQADEMGGFSQNAVVTSSKVKAVNDDGTEEILDFSIEVEPASGYILIDEFMAYHLTQFIQYAAAIIDSLTALDFQVIDI